MASALWGHYVTYVTPTGTVIRANVVTGKRQTVGHGGAWNYEGTVFTYGPYVAWRSLENHHGVDHAFVRNTSTMAAPVELPAQQFISEMTNAGIVTFDEDSPAYSLRGYGPADALTPVFTPSQSDTAPQVSDGVLAWIDLSGVLRATALPAQPVTPLPLGTPYTSAKPAGGGRTWRLSAPFSAALTSCSIVIARQGTVVRTLPCSRASMRLGLAAAQWDGTTSAGRKARAGADTWTATVTGSSGTSQSETGTVRVS